MKFKRIIAVAQKESWEIRRDPLFLLMAFFVPTLFIFLFGYGLSLDVENLPFVAIDYDRSPVSRDFLYHFTTSRYFELKGYGLREQDATRELIDGGIRLILVVPPEFQRDLASGRAAHVQAIIDGTFPYRAQITRNYVEAIVGKLNRQRLKDFFISKGKTQEEAEAMIEPVGLAVRYLYNEEAKSVWSISTALIGMVLLMVPPMLTSVAICREKETGSIYNIYVSTIKRGEFLFGKITPYFIISGINALILFIWVVTVFKAPFKGSFSLYLIASLIYALCSCGIGLLVSAVARSQIAALMISLVIAMIPSFLYSGMLVPVSCMDPAGQFESHLFPAMYFTRILHGTFLKAQGIGALWQDLLALLIYTLVVFILGYSAFHKRVRK